MKTKIPRLYFFLAATILLVGVAKCAPQIVNIVHLDLRPAVTLPQQMPSAAHVWDWTTQEWTQNDEPYHHIRTEIDQAIVMGKDPQSLLEQQKEIAKKYPNNPQAQFAWGYAAYTSLPRWAGSYAKQKQKPAADAVASLPATNCYNYARLRFLLPQDYHTSDQTQLQADARLVDALGQRLLHHDLKDIDVKYHLVDVDEVILGRNPTDLMVKKRALRYSQELIQAQPEHSNYRTLPASVYVTCWSQTNDPADARAAIASYQDYLHMAPPNEEFRSRAQYLIKVLQKGLAHPQQQ